MEKQQKMELILVILHCICAVLWIVDVVVDLVSGISNVGMVSFVIHVLCAVLWNIGAVLQIRVYRRHYKNEK